MGKVKAICISKHKGTQKTFIQEANFIKNYGIENDAHAGTWHRQVSLLSYKVIKSFNDKGANVTDGDFGENLIIEGLDLINLPIGSKLKCNNVELEITQIGKDCHTRCSIYYKMGDCIMPTNGVFAKVINGGKIFVGDIIEYEYEK